MTKVVRWTATEPCILLRLGALMADRLRVIYGQKVKILEVASSQQLTEVLRAQRTTCKRLKRW